jgi:hypothetical protein
MVDLEWQTDSTGNIFRKAKQNTVLVFSARRSRGILPSVKTARELFNMILLTNAGLSKSEAGRVL